MPRRERAKRAQELLKTFGLWEKPNIKAENFSKGMRRRLSIAMAVTHKPSLLFLDEPTPGLDAQSIRAIWEIIRKMNEEGTTVFITTHQIEEANQLCGRCDIECSMDIEDVPRNLDHPECVRCMECLETCARGLTTLENWLNKEIPK